MLNRGKIPPIYMVCPSEDVAVNPFDTTIEVLKECEGNVTVKVHQGEGHGFDEDEKEQCFEFREWIGKTLL